MLLVAMDPLTGSADISLLHVGSGAVMATTRAVAEEGGRRGFWGGRINNPNKLRRVTARITRASVPKIENMFQGIVERQS